MGVRRKSLFKTTEVVSWKKRRGHRRKILRVKWEWEKGAFGALTEGALTNDDLDKLVGTRVGVISSSCQR